MPTVRPSPDSLQPLPEGWDAAYTEDDPSLPPPPSEPSPDRCADCGATDGLHAVHFRPLQVVYLCSTCVGRYEP